MLEMFFRGKREDNGEWIEGNGAFKSYDAAFVMVADYESSTGAHSIDDFDVIPETVGRYTGLTDKNGKKIFEGDIILYNLTFCVVKYDTDNARYMLYKNDKHIQSGFNIDTMKLKEVIGNIHDNPELLEGDAEWLM